MDKKLLLQADIQAFIKNNENADLPALVMQKKYAHLPLKAIAGQIKGRQKAKGKLPLWYGTDNILYPTPVSIEQASSEITARFKAGLFQGEKSLDLTGGFGVDSYFLSRQFKLHTYVETNKELVEVVRHNFSLLRQSNVQFVISSAESFIKSAPGHYDLIYIDPDRRPGSTRVIGFEDSTPAINDLLPKLLKISDQVLIKASPMLDISLAIAQLRTIKTVYVVAVANEVKELLFLVTKTPDAEAEIRTINLINKRNQVFSFVVNEVQQENIKITKLKGYLYVPNAAIMKSGGYDHLCPRFGLSKLARNTHLYTSSTPVKNFPGRQFVVKAVVAYNKKQINPLLPDRKANISTRNFPDTPAQVKKKLGLTDGGEVYLFAYRDQANKPRLAICEKVS